MEPEVFALKVTKIPDPKWTKKFIERVTEAMTQTLESERSGQETRHKQLGHGIEVLARTVESERSGQETRHKQLVYDIGSLQSMLQALGQEQQSLSQILASQRELSIQFYDQRIIEPMARGLFPVVDMIREIPEQNRTPLLEGLLTQVTQYLQGFEIELISHDSESEFDPKVMQPLEPIIVHDQESDGRVGLSMRCGFKNPQKILRPESVRLYQYQPRESEGDENE